MHRACVCVGLVFVGDWGVCCVIRELMDRFVCERKLTTKTLCDWTVLIFVGGGAAAEDVVTGFWLALSGGCESEAG